MRRLLSGQASGRSCRTRFRGSGTLSGYTETSLLNWSTKQASMPAIATAAYACLNTTVSTSASTGTTMVEPTYTGPYARITLASIFPAASAGGAGAASTVVSSGGVVTFAGCTSGSAAINGWSIADALTTGNALHWGSCTLTNISTTQTPPTIASSGISLQLT